VVSVEASNTTLVADYPSELDRVDRELAASKGSIAERGQKGESRSRKGFSSLPPESGQECEPRAL
jgi:hypothetical protein